MAGAKNFAPDSLSRFPGPHKKEGVLGALGQADINADDWSKEFEAQVLATAVKRGDKVVSWDTVLRLGISDRSHAGMLHVLSQDETDLVLSPGDIGHGSVGPGLCLVARTHK